MAPLVSISQCATPESAAMGRSVLAAALVLTALLVVQLPAGDCGGGKICFSNPDCTGSQIPASSAEDCCVGTDDGFSYGTPGDCSECIVHGFTLTAYSTDEDNSILASTFGLNRKGNSSLVKSLPGTITSMDITATESQDYGRLVVDVGSMDREVSFELDLINDNLALEFVEELSLNFVLNPNFQMFVDNALAPGEFIRDSVIVSIADNDDLEINFDEQDRSEIENADIPLDGEVTLSLRPTQIPFKIEIIHATVTEALDKYDLAEFLSTTDFTDLVNATGDSEKMNCDLGMSMSNSSVDLGMSNSSADFSNCIYEMEIPANTESITLRNVSILDDDRNEAEEVFIVIIRLLGVAESTACFQQQRGGECMGDTGGIIIRIRDNDPMFIGFGTRNTTIRENRFPNQDSFQELFNVISLRFSELIHTMTFSVTGQRTAVVVSEDQAFSFPNWDASFGIHSISNPSDPPYILVDFDPGLLVLEDDLQLLIHNDVTAEETEFFTLRITAPDVGRGVFDCYDDTEEPVLGNFLCSHTFFIVDDDIPLNVSFVETVYTVVESDEMVEVCVNLTWPDSDILDNSVNVEVFMDDNSIYIPPNAPIATGRLPPPFLPEPTPPFNEDYPQQLLGFNDLRTIQILETRRTICYDQTVYDDVRLEADEWTGLTLTIGASTARTVTGIDHTAIRIIDDDVARVGIDPTFRQVSKTAGFVEICAVVFEPTIECPIEFDFSVSLSTSNGSAETPMDYEEVDIILMFEACETRVCTNVTIVDDDVAELTERFFARLGRTVDLDTRITLDPFVAEVEIVDNDEIVVGYEFTSYTTTEAMGSVTLCAIIYDPPSGVAPRPFTIRATTQDGTAIATTQDAVGDYEAVVGEQLVFNTGDRRQCHTVNIVDDDDCEQPAEDFFSNLMFVSGQPLVTINPAQAQVIIDDDNEPECEIIVGYEFTSYTTTEAMGSVTLCAIIYNPPSGVAPRPFTISATTQDGTANATTLDAPGDYEAVFGEQLVFNTGDRRRCHTVNIVNDDDCEKPAEDFFSDLSSADGQLTINPNRTTVFIDDDNEPDCDPIVVGYNQTVYTTTEGEGMIELCATISSPSDGIAPRPFVISASTSDGTAVSPADYTGVSGVLLSFIAGDTVQCYTVEINDDDLCEQPPEDFFSQLTYVVGAMPIIVDPDRARVVINDDNEDECAIVVGYEMTTYTTTEGMGYVELCAVITSPSVGVVSPRPFIISATTADDTAVAPGDYDELNGFQLAFDIGDNRVCHNVTINDDNLCEQPAESFLSRLSYVSGQMPITIDPEEVRVFIDDDNEPECEIIVGYEFTSYTTTEAMGSVTLCAIIYNPPSGEAPRPFTISATTQDGTAIAPGDYGAVVGEQLVFNTGDRRRCHTVNIVDDDDCEQPAEDFFSNLMFVSGQPLVTINPAQAQVIIDDDNEPECEIIVGYEFTSYTTTESMRSVTLCAIIYNPPSGVAPQPFTISATTEDGTAMAPGDYGAVVGEQLVFNTGDDRQCHTVTIVNDNICEKHFLSDLAYVSGQQVITLDPAQARVVIVVDGDDCVLVIDTLTGDPLMTVPILTDEDVSPGDEITSLCYEVHGQADYIFNLVSDTCVTVNAHFAKAPINSPNIDLNVVDAIGVRAVSNNGNCENISVGLQGCQATVNGVDVNGMYRRDNISVREYANRVRIVVPNCADTDLVMWVFCTNGQTEDPVTWEFFDFDFIRFVVRRGLNLAEESHGLIGQFWNVPVDVTKYTGDFEGAQRDDVYTITVKYPGIDARSFVGLGSDVTWEYERRPCLYVGNSQAGPLGEEDVDPNDSVIQGTYRDYRVDSMFSSAFTFSHFDETLCP